MTLSTKISCTGKICVNVDSGQIYFFCTVQSLYNKPHYNTKDVICCGSHFFLSWLEILQRKWLSSRALSLKLKGWGFNPHQRHWIVSFSKTLNPLLNTSSTEEDPSQHDWIFFDWDIKNQNTQNKRIVGKLSWMVGQTMMNYQHFINISRKNLKTGLSSQFIWSSKKCQRIF